MEQFNRYFLDVVKNKYICFEGRASRKEYWMFVLFNIIIDVVIYAVLGLISNRLASTVGLIISLGLLLPSLGICVRRLHDIGKDWVYFLIAFIPFVGAIILIIWFIKEGDKGENKFGPEPQTE